MDWVEEHISTGDLLAYNTMWLMDHIFGPAKEIEDHRLFSKEREDIRQKVAQKLAQKKESSIIPITRVENLSVSDFRKNYQSKSVPVVFSGAAKEWTCCREWTPESLAERFGDDEVALLKIAKEDYGGKSFTPIGETISFRELVKRIRNGEREYYWRFSPMLHRHPEMQDHFDSKWLQSFREKRSVTEVFQLFIGCRGTNTALHNAPASNLFVQVYGQKRWVMYPPIYNMIFNPPVKRAPYFFSRFDPDQVDEAKFPGYQYLDCYDVVLEPGDVLYVPPYFWHLVTNPTDSIGVGYRWFAPSAAFGASVAQTLLTIMATDPPVFKNAAQKAARRKDGELDLVTQLPKVSPFLQG